MYISYSTTELLYDPYPKNKVTYNPTQDIELKVFPPGGKHSIYSDVYSLGLIIFNLCYPASSGYAHVIYPIPTKYSKLDQEQYWQGTICRNFDFELNKNGEGYTEHLEKAIHFAVQRRIGDRPVASKLWRAVKRLNGKSEFQSMSSATVQPLPEWSTRVHTYHT